MRDSELVLRFFAFRERSNIKGSVRSMLDRSMEVHEKATPESLGELQEIFLSRLKLASDLFGDRVFRYADEDGKWKLSHPLYDGVMVALDRLWEKRASLKSAKSQVVRAVANLLRKPNAFEVIVGRPNTSNAVKKRLDLLTKAIGKAAK